MSKEDINMKKNEIEYKGYIGSVEWSDEDGCFFGEIKYIYDSVSYDGKTIEELKKDFKDAVDYHIATLDPEHRKKELAYKGSFNIRIGTDLHRRLAEKADEEKTSINMLVKNAITLYLDK